MNFISIIATVAVNDTGTIWSMMSFVFSSAAYTIAIDDTDTMHHIVFSTAAGTVSMDGTDYHAVHDEYCI